MFKEIVSQDELPKSEKEILQYWKEHKIFERSVNDRPQDRLFVFFEGPPTANGRPGIHHVLARSVKDFVCRYKTMCGYRVERKGGWDTHGLAVEIEVEKALKISGKKDIEAYGVEAFNRKCYESVFAYKNLWDELTDRMGYWVDLEKPYITCTHEYIESVWWILKQFYEKGLIYKGFKVSPYCPQCGTPLSSHEVAQGYEEVSDPSIYIRLKLAGEENTYFLVWTTTPWTLISNVALTVGPDIDYVKVRYKDEYLILAEARLNAVLKEDYEIVERFKGSELKGKSYERLFDYVPVDQKGFYVITGDFVTTEDGTGIVHTAPAFGEDDFQVCRQQGLPFIRPVDAQGRFEDIVTDFKGKFVKEADPDIITHLKRRGLLFRSEKIKHSYPHCWRHHTPLIYYARDAWYIRTTAFKDAMVRNNLTVNWFPPEIQEGRFGNWLRNNVDWSLSRDRYWGTPLPIWIHEPTGEILFIGSREELMRGKMKDGRPVPPDLDLHKPYVDEVVFEINGKRYERVAEVIDAWFDSGAMPYAQWHYPFENREVFEKQFPADFICEGVDQTRGWFYSLMAISTFLFEKAPYKNVVVNELVLDAEGQKMSKHKGNVVNPFELLDKYGADILRWYLLTNTPIWLPKRFDVDGLIEMKKKFFRPLIESYKFFVLYANIDQFRNEEPPVPYDQRPELDRWILSRLQTLICEIRPLLDQYETFKAGQLLQEFVDNHLSNWYIRLSRRRFWKGEKGTDKTSAYQTLYTVLYQLSKMIAPLCPFLGELLYRNLTEHVAPGETVYPSVHLANYPDPDPACTDTELEAKMEWPRRAVQLGRSLRELRSLKVRQPLSKMIILADDEFARKAVRNFTDIIQSELNIKSIEFTSDAGSLVHRRLKPNFKALGPKFGKHVGLIADIIKNFGENEIRRLVEEGREKISFENKEYEITLADVEVLHEEKEGLAVQSEQNLTVALDTHLTQDLIDEGIARETVNRIQNLRKEAGLSVTQRIHIAIEAPADILEALQRQKAYVLGETLADSILPAMNHSMSVRETDINGHTVRIGIQTIG